MKATWIQNRTGRNNCYSSVQVVAGIELISFIISLMVICFGFVTKTVLRTHQYYCWALFAQCQSHYALCWGRGTGERVHKKLWGDTDRIADPNLPKRYSIPYDVVCLTTETQGKMEEGGIVWSYDVCFLK